MKVAEGNDAYYKAVSDEWWETVNKPWLDEVIARGDDIRLVSDPSDVGNLLNNGTPSLYARELEYLKSNGYTIQGTNAVKGSVKETLKTTPVN